MRGARARWLLSGQPFTLVCGYDSVVVRFVRLYLIEKGRARVPTRMVVRLEPLDARSVPPAHTGPAAQAAFLRAVRDVDRSLADYLHDDPKFKCYAMTPLLGADDTAPTAPGLVARIEVGLLTDEHTAIVHAALTATSRFHIGRTGYRTAGVELVGAESYDQLAEAAAPDTSWSFTILTPVSFATARGQGARRQYPWPDAARVFTNLADRWDAFAPDGLTLPAETAVAITEHLEVIAADVRIAEHLVEPSRMRHGDGYRRGSVGTVTFQVAAAGLLPATALRTLDALARFASYTGMGDRTALGMGYVRPRRTGPRSGGGVTS